MYVHKSSRLSISIDELPVPLDGTAVTYEDTLTVRIVRMGTADSLQTRENMVVCTQERSWIGRPK